MSKLLHRLACAATLLAATSGCALFRGGEPQQIEVHARLDGREVTGVTCMLANEAGRWLVAVPGRVTVARHRTPLSVDCLRPGAGSLAEQTESPLYLARLEAHVRVAAQDGYYASGGIGLSYAYPATLDIALRAPVAAGPAPAAGNQVF